MVLTPNVVSYYVHSRQASKLALFHFWPVISFPPSFRGLLAFFVTFPHEHLLTVVSLQIRLSSVNL